MNFSLPSPYDTRRPHRRTTGRKTKKVGRRMTISPSTFLSFAAAVAAAAEQLLPATTTTTTLRMRRSRSHFRLVSEWRARRERRRLEISYSHFPPRFPSFSIFLCLDSRGCFAPSPITRRFGSNCANKRTNERTQSSAPVGCHDTRNTGIR